ncbi:MAG: methyltransferase domain-containing protein [bacterium]|nr:methyltransferase domain-containing protein [bacterium]
MLSLLDLITRSLPPAPWSEGDNIPWDEPAFSQRMLNEHLAQDHDLASRRLSLIDSQVSRLIETSIPAAPARVLDLACGPGLYLHRIAAAGHSGVGIDFSPASIDHARSEADAAGYDLIYHHDDLRTADFGSGFDTILLLYGQINVFRRTEALKILTKAHAALVPGGKLVLEPQTFSHIRLTGQAPPVWSSHESGLFGADPHLTLTESSWYEASAVTTQRFYIVDAATGAVERHALSSEAYTDEQLTNTLNDAGFAEVTHRPSLTGEETDDGLSVVVCARTA